MLEINEIAKRAIATNGSVFQSMIAMEECSELSQAISKCIRYEDEDARKHLVEEMADVHIMLEQLKQIYDVKELELSLWISTKLRKLERSLCNETKKDDH